MMKFFRKYNKHLLAVFMALLLVIWLGGSAVESMFAPDYSKTVVGVAATGKITQRDMERADHQTRLQRLLRLSWQQAFIDPNAPADEQLTTVDWILLVREAEKYGVCVSVAEAKSILAPNSASEQAIRRLAARRDVDVPVEAMYQAAAQFFAVSSMLNLFSAGLLVPEPLLRVMSRDLLEQASVEVVECPAESFADPKETFSEAEYAAQFEKYKADPSGRGGLNFGYFIEPEVRIEYISIDPSKIKGQLRGGESSYERRAFTYWKKNSQRDPRFLRSVEQLDEARKKQQPDATTNGADVPQPPVSPYFESFAEAREEAIDAVKEADASAEADRIATILVRMVAEPWFDVTAASNGFKPAPDVVKNADYFTKILTKLPANLQYQGATAVKTLDWINARDLAGVDGFGAATLQVADRGQLSVSQLAFNVEGLVTVPEEARQDRSLFLARWQTLTKPLRSSDGLTYLFRVVGVREGRVPKELNEVIDRVSEDLRLLRGMDRAKEAATAFTATVGTNSLQAAWDASTELVAKVTPDDGGYVANVQPFGRDSSRIYGIKNLVIPLGEVTDEFIERSFALAADPDSHKLAVVDLPNQAMVAVIKGKSIKPLYEEDYQARRNLIKRQLLDRERRELIAGTWLNAKHVRERNEYKPSRGQ